MKKYIIPLLFSITFYNCEDVIDVELPTSQERLVVEASINWFEGTTGNEQIIKLTKSAPYFNTNVPPALNAVVTITNSSNNVFNFIDIENKGEYLCTNFVPQLNETYTLNINYNQENYIATETLKPVSPIDYIEQNNEGGFSGEEIEIKAYYTDPSNEENYYFYQFETNTSLIPILEVYNDEFTDGNQIFAFFSEDNLKPNNKLNITHSGVSEQFYNYMSLLLEQSNQNSNGPFQTQPATVKGNCINTTNSNNYPFGYFRLSQAYKTKYILE